MQLLQGITTKTKLVYVEDNAAKTVLDAICKRLSLEVDVEIAGDRQKVLNISNAFKNRQIENVYFLIDNDNKPLTPDEKARSHKNTVQLERYCIENYLLDPEILQKYKNQDWEEPLKQHIRSIAVKKSPMIKLAQIALENGVSVLPLLDVVDGSEVFKMLSETEGQSQKYDFMTQIVNLIPEDEMLHTKFTELDFLQV